MSPNPSGCCEIPVACCGGAGLPTTVAVSDGTTSVDLHWNPATQNTWIADDLDGITFVGCVFSGGGSIALQCLAGNVWYFAVDNHSGNIRFGSPTGSCRPLNLSCTLPGCNGQSYTCTFS